MRHLLRLYGTRAPECLARNHGGHGRVTDRLLTAAEVAELLAVPMSWVRESTRSGTMPHVELGRYRRYRRDDVERWLDECSRSGRPSRSDAQDRLSEPRTDTGRVGCPPLACRQGLARGPARLLNSSARCGTLWACGLRPYTFRASRENARTRRVRGAISALGGFCAERRPS